MNKTIFLKGTIVLAVLITALYYINGSITNFSNDDNYYIYSNISATTLIVRNSLFLILTFILMSFSKGILSLVTILGNIYWITYSFIEMRSRLQISSIELLGYLSIHGIFEFMVIVTIFILSYEEIISWYKEVFKDKKIKNTGKKISKIKLFICCWLLIFIGGILEANVSQNLILDYVIKNEIELIEGGSL